MIFIPFLTKDFSPLFQKLIAESNFLYSHFSKNNNDPKQWIWVSDSSAQYTISEDPRGVTLGRGTQVIMHLKEKDYAFLDRQAIKFIPTILKKG